VSIKDRVVEDVKQAMKARDKLRVDCLRMLKSKIQEREVALRPQQGTDYRLTDEEALKVLATYAKQRREAIDAYRQGGREDLAAREEAELAIVESYLPRRMDKAEIEEVVRRAIAETGASSPRDMGAVMKHVMAKTSGAADGKLVSQIVRDALQKK
jgi:uncharacterized protein YqeY